MREFFKGWRRKIGSVVLVLACIFTVGWVRSRCFEDVAVIPVGQASLGCVSLDNLFVCGIAGDVMPGSLPSFQVWESGPFCSHDHLSPAPVYGLIGKTNGFGIGEMYSNSPFKVYIIPYWSIVVPLALLSAWRLLVKPRRTKSELAPSPGENHA